MGASKFLCHFVEVVFDYERHRVRLTLIVRLAEIVENRCAVHCYKHNKLILLSIFELEFQFLKKRIFSGLDQRCFTLLKHKKISRRERRVCFLYQIAMMFAHNWTSRLLKLNTRFFTSFANLACYSTLKLTFWLPFLTIERLRFLIWLHWMSFFTSWFHLHSSSKNCSSRKRCRLLSCFVHLKTRYMRYRSRGKSLADDIFRSRMINLENDQSETFSEVMSFAKVTTKLSTRAVIFNDFGKSSYSWILYWHAHRL